MPTLKLTPDLDLKSDETSTWDSIDAMLVETMKEGFFLPPKPDYICPVLQPQALYDSQPHDFSLLFCQFEQWQSYAAGHLAFLDGCIEQCDNEMSDIAAFIHEEAHSLPREERPTEEVIKNKIKCHTRWRALKLYMQKLNQKRRIIEAKYTQLGRGLRIVSRYVKIKEIEFETGTRRGLSV